MPDTDRRVRRTRRTLADALISLILEQGYERTTVQHVIDRADVGRSTFYAHFRDKEALLLANFADLRAELDADLAAVRGDDAPTALTAAVFRHAYANRRVYRALCGRQGGHVVHRHLHAMFTELLTTRLAPLLADAGSDLPVPAVVEFHTSGTLGLLTWWVNRDFAETTERLTAIHHRLTAPGLLAALNDVGRNSNDVGRNSSDVGRNSNDVRQNSTVAKAPAERKPQRAYTRRAGVL